MRNPPAPEARVWTTLLILAAAASAIAAPLLWIVRTAPLDFRALWPW